MWDCIKFLVFKTSYALLIKYQILLPNRVTFSSSPLFLNPLLGRGDRGQEDRTDTQTYRQRDTEVGRQVKQEIKEVCGGQKCLGRCETPGIERELRGVSRGRVGTTTSR